MKSPLYLLDSHAVIYRAYFAFMNRPLRAPDGRNVSAVYGFFRILFALMDERNPDRFACVFDSRKKTFRHDRYPDYKATRQKAPDDLHPQAELVEGILGALGVPSLRMDGYEADDVIASLAEACREEGRECYVISGDKDLLQLVGGPVKVLRPEKEGSYRVIGSEEVGAEWGVGPERILDYLSLTGDASDNVPGVPGIGDKTAAKLVAEYGGLDDIYARLSEVKPEGVRKKLESGKESAYFSRELIKLVDDLKPVPGGPDGLAVTKADQKAAREFFSSLGMKSLAARFMEGKGLFDEDGAPEAGNRRASGSEPSAPPSESAAIAFEVRVDPGLLGEGAYEPVTDGAGLGAWIAEAKEAGRFSFDCETESLDELSGAIVGFSLAVKPRRACYVPLSSPDSPCVPMAEAKTALASLFSDRNIVMVGQNLKFDVKVLKAWGVDVACALEDSMVAAWMLDPGRTGTAGGGGYSLEALAERHLSYKGIAFSDIVPKKGSFKDVPLEKAAPYAAEDADLALRLMDAFLPALEGAGLLPLFRDVEMPLLPILAAMEREGIRIDAKALAECSKQFGAEMEKTEKEIHGLVGHDFNIASTKQLQEVLFTERKLKTGKKTKTGFSTDTSVLEELALEDPVCELVLRHRGLKKLLSTYVDALPLLADPKGRVHTHFIQTGAATGRLSSRDPNLQNIPIREEEGRRIREAFVAETGKILVSCDYSQIELVVLAQLSGDASLREAFEKKRDVHRMTAALIFGKEEGDVTAAERRIAKTINFGVIYGMSAFRLAGELKIPRSDAQRFIDAYFYTYRGVTEFIRKTVEEAERTGMVRTVLGRARHIEAIRSRNKTEKAAAERVAVNTPIQGSAADIVKLAMLRVHAALAKAEPDARILLQVHDELLIECPVSRADSVMEIAKREMEAAYPMDVPLRVQAERALSWGDMH
jgi:DNA polymerase I